MKITRGSVLMGAVLSTAALAVVSCGGSPTAPSGAAGVRVEGTVIGPGSGASGFSVLADGPGPRTASSPIVVTVKGTSISVTVSGNGTFVLEGLPEGTFTLVFTRDGVVLGEVTVSGAAAGVKVKIILKDEGTTIVLIDLEMEGENDSSDPARTCLVNGGRVGDRIELEGTVASGNNSAFMMNVQGNRASGPVQVDSSAASFKCNGQSGSDCKANLKAGAQVHVRGTLGTCSLTEARVTASEVMVQKP